MGYWFMLGVKLAWDSNVSFDLGGGALLSVDKYPLLKAAVFSSES